MSSASEAPRRRGGRKISVLTYNVLRDNLHESSPSRCFEARAEALYRVIRDADADVLCLQECRDLPDGRGIEPFLERLRTEAGYAYQVHGDAAGGGGGGRLDNKVLKVATLWKADVFACEQSRTFWLNAQNCASPLPAAEWGQRVARPLGANRLRLRPSPSLRSRPRDSTAADGADGEDGAEEDGRVLDVWNTHLGHGFLEKLNSARLLPRLMHAWSGERPALLVGDFNFFESGGHEREAAHLRRVLETARVPAERPRDALERLLGRRYALLDVGKYARTALYDLAQTGTFVGSSLDAVRPAPGRIGDRLDYVWAHNVRLAAPARIWNKSMRAPEPQPYPPADPDCYPSDHFPIVAYVLV